MSNAIQILETGGSDVLKWQDRDVGAPGPGEIKIRQNAVGLNFIDVYMRTGLYPVSEFPFTLGMEACGVVEQIGDGVDTVSIGDRVAYPMTPGAYTEERLIEAIKVVKVPDGVSDNEAAAMMLKGLTAQYLLRRTYRVQPGDNILVYAAAGGVGLILCQWAKYLGATIIGCVGSEEKAALAKANGCDHTILYRDENVPERVKELTDGVGAAVSYDSIGQATLESSLDSLKPFGTLVSFGNASGPITDFNPGILAPKGSLYFTRPTLGTHISTRELLEDGTSELFDVVSNGHVKINIGQTYALSDTAKAHDDLEGRNTTGSTVLLP
jgi:NADPH2:quinone reductase